jgi:asparagine synthase (glutamine-hydrolysing)
MCGIAGMVRFDGGVVEQSVLQQMADAVRHRGPDGEGYWASGNVGFGHRRLSILDLTAAAAQPMISSDGTSVLIYNGAVYNFRELRRELEALGCCFRSTGDTEVVLQSLHVWGHAALSKFNGMFALAWWNARDRTVTIARDRYGIKPLYYCDQNRTIAFASEQKSFLAMPDVRRELDHEALFEYFTFQNIFTDRTLLKGVRILPAGHYAVIQTAQGFQPLTLHQYWDFNFTEPDLAGDETELREELNRLIEQAVERQLVSDVELGTYLSGGVDSGTVTAIAAKKHPYLKTFTIGFDLTSASGLELAFDERAQAEYMSLLFKTEHYEMVLKAGDMERSLPKVAAHIEEPRVGQSYPNYYAAKLASRFVKVVLSGSGGDELFGGYPWRYYRALENDGFESYVDKYYGFWQRLIPNDQLTRVFAPVAREVGSVSTRDIFRDVFQHHARELTRPEDYINHSLYFEAKTFLHGLLVVDDKLSMSHGLESRMPFLDNDLVDFAMRCPVRFKLKNFGDAPRLNENETIKYFRRTSDGKAILREAMQRYVPAEIAMARKQGFSSPDASWFTGDSIEFVRRRLFNRKARIYDLMDRSLIESLVQEHLDGTTNRRLLIWSLLSVEAWLEYVQP